MRAASGRARATALPTTSMDRSLSSMGTSRWRYTKEISLGRPILGGGGAGALPGAGGPTCGGWQPVPSPGHDPATTSPQTTLAADDLTTPSTAGVGPAHD